MAGRALGWRRARRSSWGSPTERRVDWAAKPAGQAPHASELVNAARVLLDGAAVDVVTIDMPISIAEITGRRAADSAVSKVFGGRGCGTHSPNTMRPGAIAKVLRDQFAELGFPIATSLTPTGTSPTLVEVYPHPALLVLMNASYRVPYKIAKVGRYWPTLSPSERRQKVVQTWHDIHAALGVTIAGAELPLPSPDSAAPLGNAELKRYEDALDAVVCGWIGIAYLQGLCAPFRRRDSCDLDPADTRLAARASPTMAGTLPWAATTTSASDGL
jgi:predicted RNase H-like nuclease